MRRPHKWRGGKFAIADLSFPRKRESRSDAVAVALGPRFRAGDVYPLLQTRISKEERDAERCCLQPCPLSVRSAGAERARAILEKKALSLEAARKMVRAAEAEAERNHWRGVITVVDDGGWVILLERTDHPAMTASVELAEGKALSAALFKKPTQALEDAINHGRYAAITARGFIEMQGGLLVVVDGEVIGGLVRALRHPRKASRSPRRGWPRSASEPRPRSIALITVLIIAIFIFYVFAHKTTGPSAEKRVLRATVVPG